MKYGILLGSLLIWGTHLFAQPKLSATDWQDDLRFLQHTVHTDYPNLFRKVTAEEFDAQVERLYQQIPQLQDHEILAGITRLVALFQYGHTDVEWYEGSVKIHRIPVNFYWFADGIYLEGVHKTYAQTLGARVVKVEDTPVATAVEAVRPLLSVENEQFFKAYVLDYLGIPEALHAQGVTPTLKNTVTLTLEKNGKTFTQTFAAEESLRIPRQYSLVKPSADWLSFRNQDQTPYYLRNLDKIYYFEYLPESKTVYVRHSQIQDDPEEPIPAFYHRLFTFIADHEVDKLVLDVRLNGGGNNYKNKPIIQEVIRSKINQPGKFFVIIGRRTFSACQNLVNELDNYTEAIFVGEPTSENINFYGDNRRVELPNSHIPIFLSFAWWQDKPQWENGPWLPPHLPVEMTSTAYQNNQDPVLDKILSSNIQQFVRQPIQYLEGLFLAQKIDLLKKEAFRFVQDPAYRFVDFEEQFDTRGRDLVNRNQMDAGLFVLQLNTELFPESANAWNSLGEALGQSNQKEKAISCFQKAFSLDPTGAIGAQAKMRMQALEKE